MAIDWKDIGGLIAPMAPTIGGILGGLIPFPGGAIIGQSLGSAVAAALGVPPTPADVQTAVVNGNPTDIAAKLAAQEAAISAEVEKYKAQLADVQDARATEVKYVQIGSQIQWGPVVISTLVTLGFIGCVFALMILKINFTDTSGQAFLILTGVLSQAFAQVTGYWLGSSAGSADKTAQLAALAGAAPPPSAKIIPIKRAA